MILLFFYEMTDTCTCLSVASAHHKLHSQPPSCWKFQHIEVNYTDDIDHYNNNLDLDLIEDDSYPFYYRKSRKNLIRIMVFAAHQEHEKYFG